MELTSLTLNDLDINVQRQIALRIMILLKSFGYSSNVTKDQFVNSCIMLIPNEVVLNIVKDYYGFDPEGLQFDPSDLYNLYEKYIL